MEEEEAVAAAAAAEEEEVFVHKSETEVMVVQCRSGR
jgi:hypothetical protein